MTSAAASATTLARTIMFRAPTITRYFKFNENVGNPSNLFTTGRANILVTGGVGVRVLKAL